MWTNKFAINKLYSKQFELQNGKISISPSMDTNGVKWENMKHILSTSNIYTHNLNSFCNLESYNSTDYVNVSLETNSKTQHYDTSVANNFKVNSNFLGLSMRIYMFINGDWNPRKNIPSLTLTINNEKLVINNIKDYHIYFYDYQYDERIDETRLIFDMWIMRLFPYQTDISVNIALSEGIIKWMFKHSVKDSLQPMSTNKCNIVIWEDKLNKL